VNEPPTAKRIRLLLLESQALFRESLARYLAERPDLEVVQACSSAEEALTALCGSAIDVVLYDFECGTQSQGRFIASARRAGYDGRFLIVASAAESEEAAIAIKLGAAGIFLKSEAPDRLVQAIRVVAGGAAWLDQRVVQRLANQLAARVSGRGGKTPDNPLTDREQQVLLGIFGGLTNRKIGDRLGVSEGAVKASLQNLFSRTGVRTRTQLMRIALEGSLGNVEGLPVRGRQSHG
jgi:DNA-binding NarL/FixJ family response regulator